MEFMIAGATAVAVGTAALIDPATPARVVKELAALATRAEDSTRAPRR
jgi:dihydroorotate dehydrogenase